MFEDRRARDAFFCSLGFATVSMFVYYFMNKASGLAGLGKVPDVFKQVDFWYYPVMTFFVLASLFWVARLSGFQCMKYFIAFWCMHWLFYDSLWYCLEVGFDRVAWDKLLQQHWHHPVLVRKPLMTHVFTAALLGGGFGLATLTAKRWWQICPGMVWLLVAYVQGPVLKNGLNVKDDRLFWLVDILVAGSAACLAIVAVVQSRRQAPAPAGGPGGEGSGSRTWTAIMVAALLLFFPLFLLTPTPGVFIALGVLMGIPIGAVVSTSLKKGETPILIPLVVLALFLIGLFWGHGRIW